jgi:hypothetical protein
MRLPVSISELARIMPGSRQGGRGDWHKAACRLATARTMARTLLNVVFLEFAVQGGCPNG